MVTNSVAVLRDYVSLCGREVEVIDLTLSESSEGSPVMFNDYNECSDESKR